MIRTRWLKPDNTISDGDENQIALWQASDEGFLWIDLEGEPPEQEKQWLLRLGCHPLAINDSQRSRHPPKTETFNNQVLLLYRDITQYDEELDVAQLVISLLISDRCLISVHKSPALSINHYWNHLDPDLLRQTARLALGIMHLSVGRYLEAIQAFEPNINELEDAMLEHPSDDVMRSLILYKSRLRKLRRIFSYHERITNNLIRETPALFTENNKDINHTLQDLYDRCERVHSLATMYYELAGDLIEGYLSLTSHQLNNTMRVLTVITAIFVPLTFIAGVYGMNFENMPELEMKYAYFIALGLMLSLGAGLLILFRKIRWL